MSLYSVQMSMRVAKWIYWWSSNKQSLTVAFIEEGKVPVSRLLGEAGGCNLKHHEGLELGGGLQPEPLRAEWGQESRDTTARSVLVNDGDLQDILGLCSATIHAVKLLWVDLWQAFGCDKLLSPKHLFGVAQSFITCWGHSPTGNTHTAMMFWKQWNATLIGTTDPSMPAGCSIPTRSVYSGRYT